MIKNISIFLLLNKFRTFSFEKSTCMNCAIKSNRLLRPIETVFGQINLMCIRGRLKNSGTPFDRLLSDPRMDAKERRAPKRRNLEVKGR